MPKIIQLDRHVADLIAAGEVVERPASAVKELVENSIDAGAKNITIELQNGGMTFLRITDDGCGMEPVDARTAFLRHATSKIRKKEDLACIGTLGFRGEALAAISSVSKIDLLTRAQGAENGVRLHLEAGQVLSEEPAGCPYGTTILVRELFYNTPARMKFMKSDAAESSAVFSVVQQQALAHPEISFRFLKDGQEQLHTDGQGDRMAAIYAIYGRELANNMLPVDGSWEKLRVRGFVTKPTATRGNRAWQLLRQQPLYQIPSALRRAGGGVPQPDHGGPLPGLRAGDRYARAGRGCERPPGQDGGQVLIRARGLRRGALCRFVHALQSGGPPGMENAGQKAAAQLRQHAAIRSRKTVRKSPASIRPCRPVSAAKRAVSARPQQTRARHRTQAAAKRRPCAMKRPAGYCHSSQPWRKSLSILCHATRSSRCRCRRKTPAVVTGPIPDRRRRRGRARAGSARRPRV